MFFNRKGFTLVELLVVMSIISILAAALVVSVPKVADRARDMKCKANLKNLAQANLTYASQNGNFPHAHPSEYAGIDMGTATLKYHEIKAWVNWTGSGKWANESPQRGLMQMPKMTGDLAYESLTNGLLWSFAGKDAATYICPVCKKSAEKDGGITENIWRTYAMNYHFHWHGNGGNGYHYYGDFSDDWGGVKRSASTVLMFAELPVEKMDSSVEDGDGKIDPDNDNEYIGFNHQVAKRTVGHVVYADGHVGVLIQPEGADENDMIKLTSQLCKGQEIDSEILQKMH